MNVKGIICGYILITMQNGQWEQGFIKIAVFIAQMEFLIFQISRDRPNVRGNK